MAQAKQLFDKIEPRTLSHQVVNMLRDAILGGALVPGDYLNERDIATQMGVSRIPVREALRRLAFEGLVVSTPNHGTYVKHFDERDVTEIFDLRAVLEGMACQIILRGNGFSEADFQALQEIIGARNQAIDSDDYETWLEHEISFHDYIMPRASSERLLKTWQNLHIQTVFATRDTWTEFAQRQGTHPVILDALRHGDPAAMIPLHQELYAEVRQRAIKALRKKEQG